MSDKVVTIDYTNYKGERAPRHIVPMRVDYGKNQWHPKACYMLTAMDVDKNEIRAFAIKDIHEWIEGDD